MYFLSNRNIHEYKQSMSMCAKTANVAQLTYSGTLCVAHATQSATNEELVTLADKPGMEQVPGNDMSGG